MKKSKNNYIKNKGDGFNETCKKMNVIEIKLLKNGPVFLSKIKKLHKIRPILQKVKRILTIG